MKTVSRFDKAIKKLYSAFHNDTLNPECCKQCAVGNILDNMESWKHFSDDHGSFKPKNPTDKNVLFEGLAAVITYLCELDGIPNVLDYHKLFETREHVSLYDIRSPNTRTEAIYYS